MLVYILVPLFLFISVLTKKKIGFIVAFIIFILSAFRGINVGTDTQTYIYIYKTFVSKELFTGSSNSAEVLFYYLVKLLVSLHFDPISLQVCMALITTVNLYIVFRYLKVNISFAFLVYILLSFWIFSFNGARQAVALSFILLAYVNINKGFIRFLVYITLAAGFHFTSLIAIPMFLLKNITFKNKTIYLFFLFCFIANYFLDSLLVMFQDKLINLNIYSYYFDSINDISQRSIFGHLSEILCYTVAFVSIYLSQDIPNYIKNIFVFSVGLSLLFYGGNFIFQRLELPFSIISIAYYSLLYSKLKEKKALNYLLFFVLVYSLVYISSLFHNPAGIIPYEIVI